MSRCNPAECHWKLCREFINRYRRHLPEEQVVALIYSFANSQLLMCGEANQMRQLVHDLLPCREGEAKPEVPESNSLVEVEITDIEGKVKREVDCVEKRVKQDPDEGAETSEMTDSYAKLPATSKQAPVEKASSCCLDINKSNKTANKKKKSFKIKFKPVETFQTSKEIYRNLVLFDNDFQKTQHEFNKLGAGRLLVIDLNYDVGHCRSVVSVKTSVKHFPLVEAWGSTRKQARKKVKNAFLMQIKNFCYQIVSKKPFYHPVNQIKRRQDPTTNMECYRSIIEEFSKQSFQKELTFSKEFTRAERHDLKSIAHKFNLAVCEFGPSKSRKLKIFGQTIPALAIVERIVVQKDPVLCELYDVIPPSVVEPVMAE